MKTKPTKIEELIAAAGRVVRNGDICHSLYQDFWQAIPEIKEMYEENKRLREDVSRLKNHNSRANRCIAKSTQQIIKLRDALIEALSIAQESVDDPDTVLIKHLKQTLAETKEDE